MNAPRQTLVRMHAAKSRRWLTGVFLALAALGAGAWWSWQQFWIEGPLRQARSAWNKGQLSTAARHLRVGLQRAPDNPEILLLAVRAARRLGELDEASELLQAAAPLQNLDPDAWKLERQLLDAQQRGIAAVVEADLRTVAERHPRRQPFIDEALAEAYAKDYRIATAVRLLNRSLAALPDNAVALRRRGRLHLQIGELAEAVNDLRRAVEIDPDDADGQILFADILVKAGRFDEALPLLQSQNRQRPKDAVILVDLAICAAASGELERAQTLLQQAFDQQPHNAIALLEMGRVFFERGDPQMAEKWLRQALDVDPTDRRANYLLFQSLRLQGKDEQARAQLVKSEHMVADLTRLRQIMTAEIDKRPQDPNLLAELGVLHLRNGQTRQGLHWLEQTLKIDARHRPARQALAQYYEKIGQHERAAYHRGMLQ